jgi:large subunit ribosomal protein L9
MQVILKESLENLGDAGEVVSVKAGYARNFLIPRGIAYEATDANVKRLGRERARIVQEAAAQLEEARGRAAKLEDVSVTFHARASEEGRLFGSITNADIADKLAEQGVEIDRKQIQLDEPIKGLGMFAVPIRLHAEVRPEIKVWVIKEE